MMRSFFTTFSGANVVEATFFVWDVELGARSRVSVQALRDAPDRARARAGNRA